MSSYNGSYQATLSPTLSASTSEPFQHNLLSSSISSLSSSTSLRHSSHISKTYRQASTLFLTRRLPEALTTLLPVITPPSSADDGEPAPVSGSSRTTRIKVWSLYLTILNAVVEMEPDEGKDAFGHQEWRTLCGKVRDGEVWEEVVRNGYHGVEGDVDSDVVINLATLLLAHARDQTLNQKRLETFLATSNAPNFNLDGKLSGSPAPSRMNNRYRSPAKGASGADTPRDLNARVKILELYTLHVLLRNNEWEYAREFISVSSVLDEERREAFLQALQSLQEEQQEEERLVLEERQRQEDQLRRDIAEAKKLKAENDERERKRLEEERLKRETSELDFGVESTPSHSGSSKARQTTPPPRPIQNGARPTRSSMSRSSAKAAAAPPATISARAALIMSRIRASIHQLAVTLDSNPALVMKLLAFVASIIVMFGTKAIRQRIQNIMGSSWNKVKATAGMGTKVSYI